MDYMSIKQTARIRYKTEDNPPMEGVPLLGYNKKYSCPWEVMYKRGDKYYTCMKYRSAEHRVYAQMNKLTEAGAMISLAIELLTSNIRHSYGEINFERHPRPVEVEGEDKH